MKLPFLQKLLKEKGISLFSPRDLQLLLNISEAAAQNLLWSYKKKKHIVMLRRGLYALTSSSPSSFQIANKLYAPSYISFDTAMSYHNIIPETVYSVTSATTKITRNFIANGIAYNYHRIKKSAFTGYKLINYFDSTILMADPEKSVADYLYFIEIGERGFHYERIAMNKLNQQKLLTYLKLYKRPGLIRLAEKIYADSKKPYRIY